MTALNVRRSRILVVDDDAAIRTVLDELLSSAGHDVYLARDGEEALRVARRTDVDCVVLDLRMPILDGEGFAHRFRRNGHAQTPIIMMSAGGNTAAVARRIGAAAAFDKPFDLDELERAVNAAIRAP